MKPGDIVPGIICLECWERVLYVQSTPNQLAHNHSSEHHVQPVNAGHLMGFFVRNPNF